MKIKATFLMIALIGVIDPLSAKRSCFRPGRIAEFIKNNQDNFQDEKAIYQMHGRNYEISPKVVLTKDQKFVIQPGKMDESKKVCVYPYEVDGKTGVVKVTRLEKIYKLGNRCFNPERIIKELTSSDKQLVTYRGKSYAIDQSKVPEDKQIKLNQNPVMISLKNGERLENAMEDGKPVTVCKYRVTEPNQTVAIGEIFVKRTYKTCFNPERIMKSLQTGSSVFVYRKKEYNINQDALLTDKIEKGVLSKLRFSEGKRSETIENGKVKVVCTYKTFKIDDKAQEKEIGAVLVTRDTDVKPSQNSGVMPVQTMAPMTETQSNIGSN